MAGRGTGMALMAAGAAMAVAGVVLLATDGSDPSTAARAAAKEPAPTTSTTSSSTSSSTTSSSTSTTSTTLPPAETPEDFFVRWTAALAGGDVAFLVDRLHPATYERYVRADCEAYLASTGTPEAVTEVLSVGAVDTFVWTTDGLTLDVPGATTVRVRRADDGENFIENDVHVVVGDDGVVRWFTDCGTPKEGAR